MDNYNMLMFRGYMGFDDIHEFIKYIETKLNNDLDEKELFDVSVKLREIQFVIYRKYNMNSFDLHNYRKIDDVFVQKYCSLMDSYDRLKEYNSKIMYK